MQSNIKDNVIFATPKNEQEREYIAGACVRKLGIKIPAVLDEFGNGTEAAYTGWPDRLYLIDQQGHVAFKTKPGPFGFDPKLLAAALAKVAPGEPVPVPPTPPPAPKAQAALVNPSH